MKQLIIILSVMISCHTTAGIVTPKDNSESIYSLGIGSDQIRAEKSALAALAQRMSSQIQVTTESLSEFNNGEINEMFRETSLLKTDSVPFPPYNIKDNTYVDGQSSVTISINRTVMSAFYINKIIAGLSEAKIELEAIRNQTPLDSIRTLLLLEKKLDTVQVMHSILIGLEQKKELNAQSKQWMNDYIQINREVKVLISLGGWTVVNNMSGQRIASILSDSLRQKGLATEGEVDYQFFVSVKRQNAKRNNKFLIKEDVKIELRQKGQHQSIFTKHYNYISPPSDSLQSAEDATHQLLLNDVGEDILIDILGV
ncbi:hypothetical protein ACE1OE_00240 [Vibrio sp. E150_011]